MVYNKIALTEATEAKSTYVCTDPLQFCIEAAESDHKLFEALITVDMTEAAQKHGITQLSEADMSYMVEAAEKGIKDRLLAIVEKFRTAMNTLFDRFFTFVQNLVANDKKLYEKYKELVVPEKIKDCPITGKVSINHTEYAKAVGLYFDIADTIKNKFTSDAYSKDQIFDELSKMYEEAQAVKFIDDSDKKLVEKCDANDIRIRVMSGYKKDSEGAKSTKASVMQIVKAAENKAKKEQKEAVKAAKGNDDDNAVKVANSAYETISKTVTICSKAMSAYVRTVQKCIAVDRANFVVLGNWVAKGSKTEAPAEEKAEDVKKESYDAIDEAYDMLLEMTSDSYCESVWEATAV